MGNCVKVSGYRFGIVGERDPEEGGWPGGKPGWQYTELAR
jgi:hypothetical protein